MQISTLFDDEPLCEQIRQAEREAAERLDRLTPMQRRVLQEMLRGVPNKVVAYNLGISVRTAENHRAALMERVVCKNVLALARLVVVAG